MKIIFHLIVNIYLNNIVPPFYYCSARMRGLVVLKNKFKFILLFHPPKAGFYSHLNDDSIIYYCFIRLRRTSVPCTKLFCFLLLFHPP